MDSALLQTLPLVSIDAGQVVIEEGGPLQGIFFLERGEVEVLKGGVMIAEVSEAGAVFGEMSWLLDIQPTATVRAIGPCKFRHVDDPGAFFSRNPGVALDVARMLARRLDSLNRYLVNIKEQFKDRADHLGIVDEVLDALVHKHPRNIPRRDAGH